MLLLVTTGHPDMARYASPSLGRLIQPRHTSSVEQTAGEGIPWAADNDCYQGLDVPAYMKMLRRIEGLPGCLFCTVPDVVADAAATDRLWEQWRSRITQPAAYVLQDGATRIPDDADCLFIGGSTEWKLGETAERYAREAKARGLWVHMGRVNTDRRIAYAESIGCDSIDGTQWARWKKVHLKNGLASITNAGQLRIGP